MIQFVLKKRPVPEIIQVFYRGTVLNPGPKESSGKWYYEAATNTINFYSIDFIQDFERDFFEIDFDVDDGHTRS